MSWVLTNSQNYEDIADAINEKLGTSNQYYPSEMASAIRSISGSGSSGVDPHTTFQQINAIASAYLLDTTYQNETYDDGSSSSVNFNSSVMESIYRPQAVTVAESVDVYRTDEPVPKSLQIRQNGTFHIVDDLTHIKSENVTSGTYNFYNVTPNIVAYYIDEANGSVSQCGSLTGTGQIRMIHTTSGNGESSHNFTGANIRDIGGWACDGGYIKYGKIIRGIRFNGFSSSTIHISEYDLNTFRNLIGIRSEIDLRSDSEISTVTGSAFGDDVVWHHYALQDYANSLINNQIEYRDIFKQIAYDASHNNPIYMHCMAGCDRTGTTCALLEGLLGVARYNIDKDYELSSLVNYKFRTGSSQGQVNDQFNRFRTNSSWGAFIRYLNNNYTGSTFRDKVINYLLSIGVTLDEINTIRQSLIDGDPEIITRVTYTVSLSLNHATSSNQSTAAVQGGSYSTVISPQTAYVFNSANDVTVTMGGNGSISKIYDATNDTITISTSYVTGDISISGAAQSNFYTVTYNYTEVESNIQPEYVTKDSGFAIILTPKTGCAFGSVTCMMGNTSISATDGTGVNLGKKIINIPTVTDNLVITAIANHVNIITSAFFSHGTYYSALGLMRGYRLNSQGNYVTSSATDYVVLGDGTTSSGYIPIDNGDVLQLSNVTIPDPHPSSNYFALYFDDNSVKTNIPCINNYYDPGDPSSQQILYAQSAVALRINSASSVHYSVAGFYRIDAGNDYDVTVTLGDRATSAYTWHTQGYDQDGIVLPKAQYARISIQHTAQTDPEIYLYEA